jgi:hypothetical protein
MLPGANTLGELSIPRYVKADLSHAGTISIPSSDTPGQPERYETPVPVRSDAVKARFQCVGTASGGGPSFITNLKVRAASRGGATGAHGRPGVNNPNE